MFQSIGECTVLCTKFFPHCEYTYLLKYVIQQFVRFHNMSAPWQERTLRAYVLSVVLVTDTVMVTDQSTGREESMYKEKQTLYLFLFIREQLSLSPSISCWAPQRMVVSYNSFWTKELSITCQPQVSVTSEQNRKQARCYFQQFFFFFARKFPGCALKVQGPDDSQETTSTPLRGSFCSFAGRKTEFAFGIL